MTGILVMPPFVRAYGKYDQSTGSYTIPAWLMSLITSIINLGEFLGALSSHYVGTKVGRRGGIFAGCVTVLAGTLIHAIAPKVEVLVIGRLLLGM
jgi:SP family sugar:H+ symporter-like MFS transporter